MSEIILNAAELVVTSASVSCAEGRVLQAKVSMDEEGERLTLLLPELVAPGPLRIEIAFSGTLNDQLHGFYRSTYTDPAGAAHTIATTQMEATDARRAFPCFDEPDRKAVFSITLDVPEGLAAFSNGPAVEETPLGDGRVRVRFGDTIPMSSYLVACVVGSLEATDPVDVDGTPVRVVHVPGKDELYAFAIEVAAHALRFFTEWFGLPYPGEKLDLVAIPDFAFGAMENLGCITFREVVLLVDPDRASRTELERVADVICHEIAHMWFGDLVTMKWWNGIWLNEAFATFMELLCVDAFRPQWERWTGFGMERAAAMATDALHRTRPVEYPVGPPEEANGMFDVLTYQKGASVLRMLEQYLGADRFRDGVRRYLSEHRLSNTETSDLWDAIEAASEEPVREIMDSWILQGGFPLVSVEETGGRKASTSAGVVVSQRPFSYLPPATPSAIGSRWQVPLVARTVGEQRPREARLLLGAQSEPLLFGTGDDKGSQNPTILLNARGNGYYRVRYPAEQLIELAGSFGAMDALERANLLGDTWAAVVAGQSELGDLLLLADSLTEELDPDVWLQVISALSLTDHAVDDRTRPLVAAYVRALVGPAFEQLGWEAADGEAEQIPELRAQLLAALGTVGRDPGLRS
ncbi:MAG: M1 family metallopeptidase, partial [Acidimicrobiales bacterium]